MRPSQEAKIRKDIVALFKANDEIDQRQSMEIARLKKSASSLSKRIGQLDKEVEILKFKKG